MAELRFSVSLELLETKRGNATNFETLCTITHFIGRMLGQSLFRIRILHL